MVFDKSKFCSSLVKARTTKGYSQSFLAQKLGISQKSYSHIESGFCRVEVTKFLEISHWTQTHPMNIIEQSIHGTPSWNCCEVPGFSLQHEVDLLNAEIMYLKSQNKFLQETINKLIDQQK